MRDPIKQAEAKARWRKVHPEQHKECQLRWRRANTEKQRELTKAWSKAHPEKCREKVRLWLAAHPLTDEQKKAKLGRTLRWQRNNPDKIRSIGQRRRASKQGSGGSFTPEEWFTLCFAVGFKCLGCGKIKPLAADHVVPVSKGGPSFAYNIQPLCKACNSSKGIKIIDYRYLQENSECQTQTLKFIMSELRGLQAATA